MQHVKTPYFVEIKLSTETARNLNQNLFLVLTQCKSKFALKKPGHKLRKRSKEEIIIT